MWCISAAFLIPYVIMMTFASLPLFYMEVSLEQFSLQDPISERRNVLFRFSYKHSNFSGLPHPLCNHADVCRVTVVLHGDGSGTILLSRSYLGVEDRTTFQRWGIVDSTSTHATVNRQNMFHVVAIIQMLQKYVRMCSFAVILRVQKHDRSVFFYAWAMFVSRREDGTSVFSHIQKRAPAVDNTLQWRNNGAMASQITGVLVVYSTVCWGTAQREHQSCTSLAFVRRIHRWPVNSPHKRSVTRKMFPFDDVITCPTL